MHLNYKQPTFYRFNEDSTKLVKLALLSNKKKSNVLDLCSGCGVIGIEYALLNENVSHLEFIEYQEEFLPFLDVNIKSLKDVRSGISTQVKNVNFEKYDSNKKYELIVCNPPYFISGSGQESSNYKRQICRSFEVSSPRKLLLFILNHLTISGEAFVILPRLGKVWLDARSEFDSNISILEKGDRIDFCKIRNV